MKLRNKDYEVEDDTTNSTFVSKKNRKQITYLKIIRQSVYIFCLFILVILLIIQVISIYVFHIFYGKTIICMSRFCSPQLLLSGSLVNSYIRNKHILISHKA